MSFLALTLPLSLLLAACLVGLVLRAAHDGAYDDWEGPAWRHHFDDDRTPEREEPESGPQRASGSARQIEPTGAGAVAGDVDQAPY